MKSIQSTIQPSAILFYGEWLTFLLLCSIHFGYTTEEGFQPIFNGKDLSGWDGDSRFWSVQDGAITGRTTAENPGTHNTFLIWRQGEVDDFELRLSFRVENGNSGVQYRSHEMEKWVVGGYQADIESGPQYMGCCYDEQGRGMLAERGQKTVIGADGQKQSEPTGDKDQLFTFVHQSDWNEYTIIAQGPHLIEKINGHVMSEVIDNDPKGYRLGVLALQIHEGPPMIVQFKDVRLKRLPLSDRKKVVLVAGRKSHRHGEHEHNGGVLILKSCLDQSPDTISAAYLDGWPDDPTAFDNADTIVLFMDGGVGHPLIQDNHLQQIGKRMKQGVGLVTLHYAVELPKDSGGVELMEWIGGYYERDYSDNPRWTAEFKEIPAHPITRGVHPFTLLDEWYFNIHFRPNMQGITSLLQATPPDDVRGTSAAREHPGRLETLAWCTERPDGGRGFGFTGGHIHANWGNDNFRTIVLNAIDWTAHLDVPENGVPSSVKEEQLEQTLENNRRMENEN